jgi:hypothetical protein
VAVDDLFDRVAVCGRPLNAVTSGLRGREDDGGAGVEVGLVGVDAEEVACASDLGSRRADERFVAEREHTSVSLGDEDVVDGPNRLTEVVDRFQERQTVLADQNPAGDAVVGVAGDVEEAHGRAHVACEPRELRWVSLEPGACSAAHLVADHAESAGAALPLVGDDEGVATACVASARVLSLATGVLDEGLEQESAGEVLLDDELERVGFVRDRDLRVRVEQGADQAVSGARVTDEQAEGVDVRKRIAAQPQGKPAGTVGRLRG